MSTDTVINHLHEVELYVTKVITEEYSEKLVFHDIEHTHRVVSGVKTISAEEGISQDDREIILIAAWFNNLGLRKLDTWDKINEPLAFMKQCSTCSSEEARAFLSSISYPQDKIDRVLDVMLDATPGQTPSTHLGKVLVDGLTMEWTSKKAKKRLHTRYQEFLLLDVISDSKKGYFEAILGYLREHTYHTNYGKNVLTPKKLSLIHKIEKERKELTRQEEHLLSKELGIAEVEVKKLKKNLEKASGRDDRGIQTMFRTTSRNHYTLYQMVDRKANILISVNAIILSLIVGRILGQMQTLCIHSTPVVVLMLSSLISVTFAVLAILPSKTHGQFSEEQIRAKQGNLLFFGNYHNMSFKDYNWGMLQMLSDSDYLYTSMIRDLYYFGQQLHTKYMKIRIALMAFIIGIILTVAAFLVVSAMPDFHFGGAHIG